MKFFDVMKLSLHSLMNNKTMTLLVIVVMLVLSVLVTTIIGVSIDVATLSDYSINMGDKSIDLRISRYANGNMPQLSDEDLRMAFDEIYAKNRHIFTTYIVSPHRNEESIYLEDNGRYIDPRFISLEGNPLENGKGDIVAGRLWNKEDKTMPYVWISKRYAMEMDKQVDDIIKININKRNRHHADELIATFDFTIKGILDFKGNYDIQCDMLFDYDFLDDFGMNAETILLLSSPLVDVSMQSIKEVGDIVKLYNEVEFPSHPSGRQVSSYKVSNVNGTLIMNAVIIGCAIFFSLIIILLSIGCISNAIQITVEQNRKFFGMMKAVGLRNKTVKRIVRYQAVIMITIAVVLASLICIGIVSALEAPVCSLFYMDIGLVPFVLPWYVPFIVFLLEVGLVVIFTNKSLSKISKMDVISVISEVN